MGRKKKAFKLAIMARSYRQVQLGVLLRNTEGELGGRAGSKAAPPGEKHMGNFTGDTNNIRLYQYKQYCLISDHLFKNTDRN